jgi:hypothetical protein
MNRQVGDLKADEDGLARAAGLWRLDERWRVLAPGRPRPASRDDRQAFAWLS